MDAKLVTGNHELIPVRDTTVARPRHGQVVLPAILTSAGHDAVTRFAEYFTVTIQNPHTRRAYFRNALTSLRWCEDRTAASAT